MTAFVLTAGAMLVLALFFVLPGLLAREPWLFNDKRAGQPSTGRDALNLAVLRDQLRELDADLRVGTLDASAYQSARGDLERRVAREVGAGGAFSPAVPRQRWSALGIAVAVPVVAGALYGLVGTPKALDMAATEAISSQAQQPAPAVSASQIEGMVAGLAAKLKTNPNDANGWRMLARSYETLRRFDQAVQAYQHLLKLAPNDAPTLVDYAVTLAMSAGRSLSGEPERLINRALEIDPGNIQALALSGSAAFERQDYARALVPWRQLLALAPADSDVARSIAASIAKAEALSKQGDGGKSPPAAKRF